jgi:phosphatidylinositol kinase/protein kinase (PI-3  family)
MEAIVQMVELMMLSGLPCFRGTARALRHTPLWVPAHPMGVGRVVGEETLTRLRHRFQPQLTDREAAAFMLERVRESHNNYRTNLYDAFQKRQNGIPY